MIFVISFLPLIVPNQTTFVASVPIVSLIFAHTSCNNVENTRGGEKYPVWFPMANLIKSLRS